MLWNISYTLYCNKILCLLSTHYYLLSTFNSYFINIFLCGCCIKQTFSSLSELKLIHFVKINKDLKKTIVHSN